MNRLFALPFLAGGVVVFLFGTRDLMRARESVHWPAAPGVILESWVELTQDSAGHRGERGGAYHARILYEYKAGGQVLRGRRVMYGDYGSSVASHARGIVNRYPSGTTVTVHYRPSAPEQCLLEPGLKWSAWMMPGVGLAFASIGGMLMLVLKRKEMPG